MFCVTVTRVRRDPDAGSVPGAGPPGQGVEATMCIDLEAAVAAPDSVLFRELAGELVLLDLQRESYVALDDVGADMWQALTRQPSLRHAFDELRGRYDVAPEVLRRDLLMLTEELIHHGLLDVRAG